jgi:hypothetical protein
MMPQRIPKLLACAVAISMLALPLAAAEAPIATEQLGGTHLTLTPHMAYESAVLRIAGPDNYALTKTFRAGEPIEADLLAEGQPPTADSAAGEGGAEAQELHRSSTQTFRAGEAPGGEADFQQRDGGPQGPHHSLTILPDGPYHYELVITDPAGQFKVQSGNLLGRAGGLAPFEPDAALDKPAESGGQAMTTGIAPRTGDSPSGGDPSPSALTIDDFLDIQDTNTNQTRVLLRATTNDWRVVNHANVFRIGQFSPNFIDHFNILPVSGNTGVGTSAPQRKLHVHGAAGTCSVRLSRAGSDGEYQICTDFQGDGSMDIRRVAPTGALPFKLLPTAPTDTLVVGGTGTSRRVGIGTANPLNNLHLVDSALPRFTMQSTGTDHQTWQIWNQNPFGLLFGRGAPGGAIAGNIPLVLLNNNSVEVGSAVGATEATLHVRGDGSNSGMFDNGTLNVRRTNITANIRFQTTAGDNPRSYLFQNNPANGLFSIRDETGAASVVSIFPGGTNATLILRNGRWGLQVTNPSHPLHAFNGAHLSAGGQWVPGSSREIKTDIEALSLTEAMEALLALEPIKYRAKADPNERNLGFIAEDVPELVARQDRTSLSTMDLVAVLTRVVQQQQTELAELQERLARMEAAGSSRGN